MGNSDYGDIKCEEYVGCGAGCMVVICFAAFGRCGIDFCSNCLVCNRFLVSRCADLYFCFSSNFTFFRYLFSSTYSLNYFVWCLSVCQSAVFLLYIVLLLFLILILLLSV